MAGWKYRPQTDQEMTIQIILCKHKWTNDVNNSKPNLHSIERSWWSCAEDRKKENISLQFNDIWQPTLTFMETLSTRCGLMCDKIYIMTNSLSHTYSYGSNRCCKWMICTKCYIRWNINIQHEKGKVFIRELRGSTGHLSQIQRYILFILSTTAIGHIFYSRKVLINSSVTSGYHVHKP